MRGTPARMPFTSIHRRASPEPGCAGLWPACLLLRFIDELRLGLGARASGPRMPSPSIHRRPRLSPGARASGPRMPSPSIHRRPRLSPGARASGPRMPSPSIHRRASPEPGCAGLRPACLLLRFIDELRLGLGARASGPHAFCFDSSMASPEPGCAGLRLTLFARFPTATPRE